MDCVVKIQLKQDAPVKKILNIFKVNKSKERASFLPVDNDFFALKNVLSIPYGMLGEDPQIVMDFIIFKLTELYGVEEEHYTSGNMLACYYINNTKTFLTSYEKMQSYGINLDNSSYLTIEEAIKLRNDKDVLYHIGFVETRIQLTVETVNIKNETKDALERAEFIIYDNIED